MERRLAGEVEGEVLFGAFDRGRYATDASNYQVMPKGVVVPRTVADVEAVMGVCREEGVAVTPRGGGTSQCGQTVNDTVVLDLSRHMNRVLEVDADNRTAVVEPGLVLDELNRELKDHGLWYPVDVSTASRATLGGMTANNSCGARSIRYGMSRDNVSAIDAILADGSRARFEEVPRDLDGQNDPRAALFRDLLALGEREADEIARAFPDVPRRVGGYNIDALVPKGPTNNLATLLVGSEGTLAFFERITLKLSPVQGPKVMGLCHFPGVRDALDATQHIVPLGPTAVELMDSNMLGLARAIPIFQPVIDEFVRGDPKAILMVEFAEDDMAENRRRLKGLNDIMADLGFHWDRVDGPGGVVEAAEAELQARIVEVRRQGLNIMMSMKDERKPIAFIEDACVPLDRLADYAAGLEESFARHGTSGTFYAHASVGTLHVRPILNLKLDADVRAMRAIAEDAFELAVRFGGTHSGEHGDGIARGEFNEVVFGARMARNFEEVKDRMDPGGLFNPHRLVRPPRMDDRRLLRYGENYRVPEIETVFRWPGHGGAGRGFQGAVEMCNNNGACRKLGAEVMCPSYRVTRAERDLTRGRANSLRLAISGQLGPDALTSDAMAETLKLCVSCKACRRECPTGVDMAKMKIEVLAKRRERHGLSLRDRLVGHLPYYAPFAARAPGLVNLRNRSPWLARLLERTAGISATRPLPEFARDPFRGGEGTDHRAVPLDEADVILWADTFNRWYEPENLRAAERVLTRAGLRVGHAEPNSGRRPLCCGRTYLSAGMPEKAKAELERTLAVLRPALERGVPVVGLEPSCVLTFRDEAPVLLDDWPEALGARVMLFEEHLEATLARGDAELALGKIEPGRALLHGHCHQKSFNQMGPVERLLGRIPGLKVEPIPSSCCGMAGSFGYQAETQEESRAMAELSLLPRVRDAGAGAIVVADGTSCRHQIADLGGREALHVARVLDRAVEAAR
ncbi:MAG TPA: FAD-binding protein [Thermohalobaculum sp.]|nr:FAD-binding protein [Thermohalobaculum sp.]